MMHGFEIKDGRVFYANRKAACEVESYIAQHGGYDAASRLLSGSASIAPAKLMPVFTLMQAQLHIRPRPVQDVLQQAVVPLHQVSPLLSNANQLVR
jgi:hypothetical protein